MVSVRPKKNRSLHIKVSLETLRRLDERAAKERRNRSDLARVWIEDLLEGKPASKEGAKPA